jgi:hypothetical protein
VHCSAVLKGRRLWCGRAFSGCVCAALPLQSKKEAESLTLDFFFRAFSALLAHCWLLSPLLADCWQTYCFLIPQHVDPEMACTVVRCSKEDGWCVEEWCFCYVQMRVSHCSWRRKQEASRLTSFCVLSSTSVADSWQTWACPM